MTDQDSEDKSKAYQRRTPKIAKRIDVVMKNANRSLSRSVSVILGDLRKSGAFKSKQEAYEWLKQTPNQDAVDALIRQAESLKGPQKRKLMAQILSGAKASRMSRLEALDASLRINRAVIVEGVKRNVSPAIKAVVKDAYLRQTFQLQKGVGVGWAVDEPPVGQIVAGMNSTLDRMAEWYHGPLDDKLRDRIVEGIATGQTHREIAKGIEEYEVPPARAKAVARTMVTTVSNEAELSALKETRIKRYEYVATLDERTCPVCGRLDGKTFPLDKAKAGVNFPPMHPNCRCVHVASLSKDIKEELTRSARDENGRTTEVPASMTYEDWTKKFGSKRAQKALEKSPKPSEDESKYDRDVPTRERRAVTMDDFGKEFADTPKKRKNTERIVEFLNAKEDADPNAVAVVQNLMSNRTAGTGSIKIKYAEDCHILPDPDGPQLVIPDQSDKSRRNCMGTTFHEMTHMSDFFHRSDPESPSLSTGDDSALTKAIKSTPSDIPEDTLKLFKDFKAERTRLANEHKAKSKEWNAKIDKMARDKSGKYSREDISEEVERYNAWIAKSKRDFNDTLREETLGGGIDMLEDIYDAISKGTFRDDGVVIYGHGSAYYRRKGMKEAELIANYTSLSITRPDLIAQLRKDKPELCKELDRVMYELGVQNDGSR